MAKQRKLGRPARPAQSLAPQSGFHLLWYGKIETTLARAKEVRSVAERLITLAVRECDNNVEVTKSFDNEKGQTVTINVTNDLPPSSMPAA